MNVKAPSTERKREKKKERVCEVYVRTGVLQLSTETRHGVFLCTGILKPGAQIRNACASFQRTTYQYDHGMFMCALVYLNQVLKQGMVYSCILKSGTQNQAHKPGIRHFTKFLILHVAFQYFSIPWTYLHYHQENNYTKNATHSIPAHASRLPLSPGYLFTLSLIHDHLM